VLTPATINRTVDRLRYPFNWGRRRIDEHEEAALLHEAPPHIQAMLIAALDTGMRQGETLAVRLADIDLARGLITLRGHTTKSGKSRVVPISTDRLRDVLALLRVDAEGQQEPDEAFVFSNEVGAPLRLFHPPGKRWCSAPTATRRRGPRG